MYLGQDVSLDDSRFSVEIDRRIRAANFTFNRYRSLFAARKVPMPLKKRLFEGAVLPALIYASETWTLSKRLENRLAVAQRRWKRSMLGCSLLDRRTNEWVRDQTGLVDAVRVCGERRWRWAARIASQDPGRWTRAVLEVHPRGPKRRRGRPAMRWRDDFVKTVGPEFLRKAENAEEWSRSMTLQIP